MKNKNLKAFRRSFFITFVVSLCIIGGLAGAAIAYENTLKVGYGRDERAFLITENGIKIFDYHIFFGNSDTMEI